LTRERLPFIAAAGSPPAALQSVMGSSTAPAGDPRGRLHFHHLFRPRALVPLEYSPPSGFPLGERVWLVGGALVR